MLQSVNNRTQNLREILRMVIIDTVINTLFGGLTRQPAGMHCPSWDDAFVSSLYYFDSCSFRCLLVRISGNMKKRDHAVAGISFSFRFIIFC